MTYMKGDNNMPTVLPKENEVEQFFSRIMASEGACERLSNVLYDHLSDDDMQTDPDPKHLVQVLLTAYTNGDISALLLELCGRSLFDLLREAYLGLVIKVIIITEAVCVFIKKHIQLVIIIIGCVFTHKLIAIFFQIVVIIQRPFKI